jgi:hypothetical protein
LHAIDRAQLVRGGRPPSQQPGRDDDGVQRIAQIVAEDPDECFGEARLLFRGPPALPLVDQLRRRRRARLFDLLEQPRVVDRERGPVGQRARELQVRLAVF